MSYSVTIRDILETRGIEVAEFTARVMFQWHTALVGTWHDEAPYEAHGELMAVVQLTGPVLPDATLAEWAADWLADQADLEAACFRDGGWACRHKEAAEHRKQMVALAKVRSDERRAAA